MQSFFSLSILSSLFNKKIQHFVIKLVWYCISIKDGCAIFDSQCQNHSEGPCNKNVTTSAIFSKLLIIRNQT